MKYLKHSLFLLIIFLPQLIHAAGTCEGIDVLVANKQKQLEQSLSSLDSLLNRGKDVSIPVEVLFQIDLKDETQVSARITALDQLQKPETIAQKDDEFKKLASCAVSEKVLQTLALLQAQLNEKKITFLNFKKELRDELLGNYTAQRSSQSMDDELSGQIKESQETISKAQANLEKIDKEASVFKSPFLEKLKVAQALLESFNLTSEETHIGFISTYQGKKKVLDDLRAELPKRAPGDTVETIQPHYAAANSVWGKAVEEMQNLFESFNDPVKHEFPQILEPGKGLESNEAKLYQVYQNQVKASQARQGELAAQKTKLINELKSQSFLLLKDAGDLRASLMTKCDDHMGECYRPRGLSEENIQNLFREIRIIPLRTVSGGLTKWFELKTKIQSGIDGWVDLIEQIAIFIFLIMLPFLIMRVLEWVAQSLEHFRKDLIMKSMIDYRQRTSLAVWIARLNPFIPSTGMFLCVQFARGLVQRTDLREISFILFYLQLYYAYRFCRIFIKINLEVFFAASSMEKVKQIRLKVAESARRISRLIFIQYAVMHLIRDAAREAITYNLAENIVFFVSVIFFLRETDFWKEEVSESFRIRFTKLDDKVSQLKLNRLLYFLRPFQLVMVIVNDVLRAILSKLSQIDLVKRVLSDVFRRKLERLENDDESSHEPSKEYSGFFDYYLPAQDGFYVKREGSTVEGTLETIRDWVKGHSHDDLTVIVGNRGMGKTTTLARIYTLLDSEVTKTLSKVPTKVTTKKDLFDWLTSLCAEPITSVEEFKEYDSRQTSKRCFFIDDIQNLFLSQIGGFEAYEIFIEILALGTKNVFWCLTVNSRSWTFLKGVYGREHFYGKVIELMAWRDFEIQKLILSRHAMTEYAREYDKSLNAYGANDSLGQQIESKFFRLLWGQSRGNPRSALMYWMSAVSEPMPKLIHVGVPAFVSSALVATMSDEALFLLAAIARHESLKFEELRKVTGISDSIIRKCLKESEDKDLVWTDEEKRVRISSKSQYVIDYYLIGKNFLYE